jgi:hypothetical protein
MVNITAMITMQMTRTKTPPSEATIQSILI